MQPESTLQFIEKQIDEGLDRLLCHQAFLKSASMLLNFSSYRRKWTRSAISHVLSALELPTKSEQEKILALLSKLDEKLEDLEVESAKEKTKKPDGVKKFKPSQSKPVARVIESEARSVGS